MLIFGNQSSFGHLYGSSGLLHRVPDSLQGGQNLGFMFLPNYRAWVIAFSVLVVSVPGSSSSARGLVPICAQPPRTPRWCARSA